MQYTEHAIERMEERGITQRHVNGVIVVGKKCRQDGGRLVHDTLNLRVVTVGRKVVTAYFKGGR